MSFTDTLPDGLIVAKPNGRAGNCGGTVTATPNTGEVRLSGAQLAAGASCIFSVHVTGTMLGMKNNSVTATSEEAKGTTGKASLMVVAPGALQPKP